MRKHQLVIKFWLWVAAFFICLQSGLAVPPENIRELKTAVSFSCNMEFSEQILLELNVQSEVTASLLTDKRLKCPWSEYSQSHSW